MKKLRIAVIDDKLATFMLDSWIDKDLGSFKVSDLVEWYKDRELNKERPNHIYRGITLFDGIDYSKLFRKGIIELDDRGYDSWSKSPHVARSFARMGEITNDPGVVISSGLSSKTNHIDINMAYAHLGLDSPYSNECEIITTPSCTRCSLKKDVEFFVMTDKFYSLFRKFADSFGWETVDSYKGINFLTMKDNRVSVFNDVEQVISNLKRKWDSEC